MLRNWIAFSILLLEFVNCQHQIFAQFPKRSVEGATNNVGGIDDHFLRTQLVPIRRKQIRTSNPVYDHPLFRRYHGPGMDFYIWNPNHVNKQVDKVNLFVF